MELGIWTGYVCLHSCYTPTDIIFMLFFTQPASVYLDMMPWLFRKYFEIFRKYTGETEGTHFARGELTVESVWLSPDISRAIVTRYFKLVDVNKILASVFRQLNGLFTMVDARGVSLASIKGHKFGNSSVFHVGII